jgi:hypothetical protein
MNCSILEADDKYKDVLHQNDIWHGGKSLAKKINAVSLCSKGTFKRDFQNFLVYPPPQLGSLRIIYLVDSPCSITHMWYGPKKAATVLQQCELQSMHQAFMICD